MSTETKLVESFQTTYWLIGKFAASMTNEDSLAKPSFRSNTFNWVLGHILVSRNRVLSLLNLPPVLEELEASYYETGSAPVTLETAVSLDRLLQALEASQNSIAEGLGSAAPEKLAELFDRERDQTIGDRIAGLHWHETYHVGQLEILRQVSREREAFP